MARAISTNKSIARHSSEVTSRASAISDAKKLTLVGSRGRSPSFADSL
jgi:hypothetical protein